LACECFTSEQASAIAKHIFPDDGTYLVWDKILTFFSTPDPYKKGGSHLSSTLGGYINKIFSFWLIKAPGKFLTYLNKPSRKYKII
jgi:hypothetical protein